MSILSENAVSALCAVCQLGDLPQPSADGDCELSASGGKAELRYEVSPLSGGGSAAVRFSATRALYLGAPNDEALNGHRLFGNGLRAYAFQEVLNSDWIAELERSNRVHPGHSPTSFGDPRHFIVTFKEETFECVADAFDIDHSREETAQ